jgi:hypothetical protein
MIASPERERRGCALKRAHTKGASRVATGPYLPDCHRVTPVEFSKELRDDIAAGDITLTIRLWRRPQVKVGGRYRVGLVDIEVDRIEQVPFASVTTADIRRAGEESREALRARTAHAGPVTDNTTVYRIEFHTVT